MPQLKLDRLIFALVLLLLLVGFDAHAQTRELPDFKTLMKSAGPSVVNVISTRKAAQTAAAGGSAPADSRAAPREGLGSGFIISEDGYILTNAHVVADFDDVNVRLADSKREFKAKVIGLDKRSDVALLKVDAQGLPTARLGDSSKLEAGDWVAAIGSPFGFANTITAGIVSAKGRSLPEEMYVPFIQTDVAVNPGNSGGPLLNLQGEVIGVNSLIYSGTGGYMGLSFAIPIEVALDVSKQLRSQGKVTRGRVGIAMQPVTKELARSFHMDEATGAIITNVENGGPAAKAGARVGDVVLEWNGEKIEDPNELPRLVAATQPGSLAHMVVWRDAKRQPLELRVGEVPAEGVVVQKAAPAKEDQARLGVAVRELTAAERQALGVDYGLLVLEVSSRPGPGSNVLPGDVIVGVNQARISNRQQFDQLLAAQKKGDMVALFVRRGELSLYVPLEVG
jgi:serine protease Do